MDNVNVTANLVSAESSVTVSASTATGGQLLSVIAGAYDVTVVAPGLPLRLKWRVGTSGDWSDLEGGEGFSVTGADSASVYLAKYAPQASSVAVAVTVRSVGALRAGGASVSGGSGGGLLQKFMARLDIGAPYRTGESWLPAPARVPGKIYGTGSVVQEGGNLYSVISSYGACGAGALAGTGAGPITDGAIKWLYRGPANVVPANNNAAIMTFGAIPAACTRLYNPRLPADVGSFWFGGAEMQNFNAWGASGFGVSPVDSSTAPGRIEWVTAAPVIAFSALGNIANESLNDAGAWNFMIDGVPMYKYGGAQNGLNINGGGIILDLSGEPIRERHFATFWGNRAFTSLHVPPQYKVRAPLGANRYTLITEGDSTMMGGSPGNGDSLNQRFNRLALMLGCDKHFNRARGNTGFINSGSGPNMVARIPGTVALAPDIIYIAPVNNDQGNDATYNSVTRIAAYKAYFSGILSALPKCIIVASGGYNTTATNLLTTAASGWQVDRDMEQAVSEFGSKNVQFVSSMRSPDGRWLEGDGHIGTTANTAHGNSDWFVGDGAADTLHPNARYYEYVQWRDYNAVVEGVLRALS